VVDIQIPPLKERPEDIPLLVNHFVKLLKKKTRKPITRVSPETLALLRRYPFSGNVRELENAIEHAFVMCHDQEIQVPHLPTNITTHVTKGIHTFHPQKSEKDIILEVLQRNQGNKSRAADELGMHRSTLWRKLRMHEIE
jgi:DNA-binding NtrC family response regulator